jgi:hypothetical protein
MFWVKPTLAISWAPIAVADTEVDVIALIGGEG